MSINEFSSAASRLGWSLWRRAQAMEKDVPSLADVRDIQVTGAAGPLRARLYDPIGPGVAAPLLAYFHGGGWFTGGIESHDVICRRLADASGWRIASVAYRLAPTHKFPAAPEDALAAVRWLSAHARTVGGDGRLAVAGDSAGGNLAAVAAQRLRREVKLDAQILFYPCLQLLDLSPTRAPFAQGRALTRAGLDYVRAQYLTRPEDALDLRCSPLLCEDLVGLPPTLVMTAGLDPLTEEAQAYAARLMAAGVAVASVHYPQEVHGFLNLTAVSAGARGALAEAGAWLASRAPKARAIRT